MSAVLEGKPDKNLILVTGRSHPKLAKDVAEELGVDVLETTQYDFANGEMYIRYTQSVRGADVFVLQTATQPTNKFIMEHLIMIDALKRASANSITAVCPLMPYSRQDKKHQGREPISSRLDLSNVAVVSPDAGRIKVAEQWAQRLGGAPLSFVHKTRDITRPNHAVANRVVGEVEGKDCVLVDDLIDTGGTIAEACHVIMNAGAKSVTVVATHGVLSDPAVERLKNCGAREVVITNTVPVPQEKRWDGLTVLSIAPLLASGIRAVFEDTSMANVFNNYPTHHQGQFQFG